MDYFLRAATLTSRSWEIKSWMRSQLGAPRPLSLCTCPLRLEGGREGRWAGHRSRSRPGLAFLSSLPMVPTSCHSTRQAREGEQCLQQAAWCLGLTPKQELHLFLGGKGGFKTRGGRGSTLNRNLHVLAVNLVWKPTGGLPTLARGYSSLLLYKGRQKSCPDPPTRLRLPAAAKEQLPGGASRGLSRACKPGAGSEVICPPHARRRVCSGV